MKDTNGIQCSAHRVWVLFLPISMYGT